MLGRQSSRHINPQEWRNHKTGVTQVADQSDAWQILGFAADATPRKARYPRTSQWLRGANNNMVVRLQADELNPGGQGIALPENIKQKKAPISRSFLKNGVPTGIRTPVATVKG